MAEERVQRRLAAIFVADVAGYSRLMGADEEGTLARLKALRRDLLDRKIEEHRGRIVKTTGDGLLAEFASVVEAVRCAVEVQREMAGSSAEVDPVQRMALRIGINVGDIVVEGVDIYGDSVNVAARLQGLAEPGGICVSARVQEDARGKLDVAFDHLGERRLKNIAWPIKVYRAQLGNKAAELPPISPLPDNPSIAILPFVNMSGDPEQASFAEGLAEDLITDLSKVAGFLVIARNSSFAYRGRSVDIRSMAAALGVRYVVEGSVRRASARVRISAQLIDATTGNHLWAERYDRDLTDIFAVQDEVVGRIVGALSGRLPSTHAPPRRKATNLEAYDLFVRGRRLATQTPEDSKAARLLLRKAIDLDPGFAEAHAWLAMTHWYGWLHCGEAAEERRTLARAGARQAVSLDPDNADARIVLGVLRAYDGELAEGVAEIEMGLRINPNHAGGWNMLADLRVLEGRAAEGIDCARNSFRLDPLPPGDYYWPLGWAQYAAGRYQDAVETLSHGSASGPGVRRILAAALAQLGRVTEAREEARKFLLEFPQFSAEQWGRTQPFRNDADRQHFIDGYIKAGLPP